MYYRLKKNCDFDKAFRLGKRSYSKTLTAIILRKEQEAKVGYVVTKKHGNAVKRNRVKRVFRAAFREIAPFVIPGAHLIFLPKAGITHGVMETAKNMRYVLDKEGLILSEKSSI